MEYGPRRIRNEHNMLFEEFEMIVEEK